MEEADPVTLFFSDIEDELRAIETKHLEEQSSTGRKTKLCYTRLKAMLRGICNGAPIESSAIAAGIRGPTWRDWCEQHPALKEMTTRAYNCYVQSSVAKIADGRDIKGNPDWKAVAWSLERRAREDFAAPKQVEINNNVTNNTLTLALDPGALAEMQQAHRMAIDSVQGQSARKPLTIEVQAG